MSWSIIEAKEVDLTFQMLFEEIKSGKFDCIRSTVRGTKEDLTSLEYSRDMLITSYQG